jgi:gliding motility-associated-like protein
MTIGGTGLTGGAAGSVSNPFSNPQGINSGCMYANVPGPQWMVLTVSSNGNLGFSLGAAGSPNPQMGFYDWILWPINGGLSNACTQLFNNNLPPVACNWNCTSSGGTGMGTVPAGATACNFQPSIPVTAGQQFIFLFSNYSGVNGQVTFQSTGSAGLTCSPLLVPSPTVCPNQMATITPTWMAVTNPISYTVMPGGATSVGSFTVSAPATQAFTVLAASTNSANNAVSTSAVFTLNITTTTTLAITNPTNYCHASSLTFTANPGGATTYSVTGPGITTTTFNTNQITIPNASTVNVGTYSIVAQYSTGCIGFGTTPVNVSPNYTIAVNSNSNACQGSTVNLTAALTTATAYAWTGPNAFSSNVQNPSIPNIQPTSAGVYTVNSNILFNGKVCPRTATTQVDVVATNPVVVTPNFTVCQSGQVNLTSSALSAVNYSWTGPAYNSSVQNPTITNLMPVNSGDYSVTAYFTNGVLTCTRQAVSNLSVVPTSPVVVNIPANICQYATANISATAPGAVGFSWIGPNNFFSTATPTTIANIQPISTGAYSATALFTMGTVSCTTIGSAQMNVVNVNSITVNPPASVCYPGNIYLQSSSPNAQTYFWNGPNSFTANVPSPILTNPPVAASGIYTVTASFNNGILTCFNSNTTQVTVNPILTFTLPPYNMVCYNTLFNVNGPAGGTSYTWTSSNGYTSNNQNLTIPGIQPTQSGSYTLEVSLGPCNTKAKTDVEVLTPIQFTLTPNSRAICEGDSLHLVMGSTGGSENYAYQWNPPVFLASPTGSTAIGMPVGTTIYQVTGYDIACPQYSVTHSFTVQVNHPPKPMLDLEKVSGCQPLCLFYDSKTKQEAAITTYDFGGDLKMQADSFRYCLNEPGTYNLKIYSKGLNGCFGTYEYPVPIVVYPTPHTSISTDPELPNTASSLVTFYPAHQYGPVISYEWMFQGASGMPSYDTSSVKNPQRIYGEVGKFPVMLVSTTDHGCKDTIMKVMDIRDEMTVYIPNTFTPNNDNLNDIFNVRGVGLRPENYSMEIFDRWGNSVYSTRDILKGWDGTIKGQMAGDGVYIYKIKIVGANGEGKKEYIGHVSLLK